MADQCDVYVRNNLSETIGATRFCLPGDNNDLDLSITAGNEDKIYLAITQSYLTINLPAGMNTAKCPFSVSNEDLLSWTTMDDRWKVEIKPNNVPPDTPTTVNIDLGGPGS
jgi:hypothetical protein